MDLFTDDPFIDRVDRRVYQVIDLAAFVHNELAVNADLLRRQARMLDELDTRMQHKLRLLAQAVADLRAPDEEPESDELATDDDGKGR